ncbi:MAG: hypothetical protein KDD25_00430 [Bdellovibrionales bacterium]|nr:hypothetical protein [Bdellovibrionales bacterium]
MRSNLRSLLATFGLLVLMVLLSAYLSGCGKKDGDKKSGHHKNDDYYYNYGNYPGGVIRCNQGSVIDSATGYSMSRHQVDLAFCASGYRDPYYGKSSKNRQYDYRYQSQSQYLNGYSGPISASGILVLSERINSSFGFSFSGNFGWDFGGDYRNNNRRGPYDPRYQDPCYIPPGEYSLQAVSNGAGSGMWRNRGFSNLEMIARPRGSKAYKNDRRYRGVQLLVRTLGNEYDNFIGGYYSGSKYLSVNLEISRADAGNRCQPQVIYFGN